MSIAVEEEIEFCNLLWLDLILYVQTTISNRSLLSGLNQSYVTPVSWNVPVLSILFPKMNQY